jgi:hypothetical protein
VVNVKAALRLTMPPLILACADEIIEWALLKPLPPSPFPTLRVGEPNGSGPKKDKFFLSFAGASCLPTGRGQVMEKPALKLTCRSRHARRIASHFDRGR